MKWTQAIKEKLDDGSFGVQSSVYGRQLWIFVKVRQNHRCHICQKLYGPKSPMFRPLTNTSNRMERICDGCMTVTQVE